jgi:hypothetical protein
MAIPGCLSWRQVPSLPFLLFAEGLPPDRGDKHTANGPAVYDRCLSRISDYSFGRVTVDGVEHTRDVIVVPERVVGEWWRRDGHSLVLADLDEVLDELPEQLVIGCGAHGRLEPDPSVAAQLAERGVRMEALPTAEAVERFGELERRNPAAVAAALHLTC